MVCSGCNVIDELLLKRPGIAVFYGIAGSGKTNIVFRILRCSSKIGKRGIYVSTEGSVYKALVEKWFDELENVLFAEAVTENDLVKIVNVLSTLNYRLDFVVIDTINTFYRLLSVDDISYALRFLSFIMAQLRHLANKGVYVLLTAQIREVDEEEVAGVKVISFWSDYLIKIDVKKDDTKRLLVVEIDNANLTVCFKITDRGVAWVGYELTKRGN